MYNQQLNQGCASGLPRKLVVAGEDLPTPPYQAPKKGSRRESKAAAITEEIKPANFNFIKQHNSRKRHSFTNARNSMF
jgi:hypothetical protein